MRRLLVVMLVLTGATIALRGDVPCDVLAYQPACYVTLEPGPTEDALRIIEIGGQPTFASTGELVLTTVGVDESVNVVDWVRGALSGDVDQVSRDAIFGPGETSEDVRRRNVIAMESSQIDAAVAAMRFLGYDVEATTAGAQVLDVVDGSPADGDLEVGDVVVAVDGTPVETSEEVVDAVRVHAVGEDVVLGIQRGTERLDVRLELEGADDDPSTPQVGVLLRTMVDLPVDLGIDAGSIGGPSAGLMFALAIIDLLGPDDLTGGAVIAGTGVIDGDGNVAPVGGIRQKIAGALARGDDQRPASVFLVPHTEQASNFEEARAARVRDDILLVPVGSLREAVDALAALREGRDPQGAYALSPPS